MSLSAVEIKVVFLGDAAVGKTSLIAQYNFHSFEQEIDPTVGSAFILKTVETPRGTAALHIWDTAGQEKYRGLTPMYTRNAMVAVLVIDVSSEPSWRSRDYWASVIQEDCPPDCRVYVVANKYDLEPAVSINVIQEWAKDNNFEFFKTSATSFDSVSELFTAIANDLISTSEVMYQEPRLRASEKKSCC